METNEFASPEATNRTRDVNGGIDRGNLRLRRVRLFVLLIITAIVIVRLLPFEPAVINIATGILLAIGLGGLLFWWTFFSGLRVPVRVFPGALLVVGGGLFVLFYKVDGVTAGMIPRFVRRGVPSRDALLVSEPAQSSRVVVDMTQTTEHDFPRFLGAGGEAVVRGIALDPDWAAHPPKKLWQREVGSGWSAFAAVNGFAVTMEQRGPTERVTCYRIDDGEPAWSHGIEARHETLLGYVGPRATPTIVDGRVYALGATGVLRCLDGASGEPVWIRDLVSEFGMNQQSAEAAVAWGRSGSPLVHEGVVHVPVGGPRDGKKVALLAMNAETGETKWEAGAEQISYASPALITLAGVQQIAQVNENSLVGYALDDGRTLWSVPWPSSSTGAAAASQPRVVGASRLFLSKGYGHGSAVWDFDVNEHGDWDVQSIWESRVLKTKFSSVVVNKGVAYGLDDAILSAVDLATGSRLWKRGRYGFGQILLVGDHLLVLSEKGELALVNATGDEFTEVARIDALSGTTWNPICLYHDRLLVRNSREAACYQLKLADE